MGILRTEHREAPGKPMPMGKQWSVTLGAEGWRTGQPVRYERPVDGRWHRVTGIPTLLHLGGLWLRAGSHLPFFMKDLSLVPPPEPPRPLQGPELRKPPSNLLLCPQ